MRSALYIAPFVAAVFAQEDMDSSASATTTVSCSELHAFILAIDIGHHGWFKRHAVHGSSARSFLTVIQAVPVASGSTTITSTYTYSNTLTNFLSLTNSDGVITGMPSVAGGPAAETSQPALATGASYAAMRTFQVRY